MLAIVPEAHSFESNHHCRTCKNVYMRSYRTKHKQKNYGKRWTEEERIENRNRIQWLRDNGVHLDYVDTTPISFIPPEEYNQGIADIAEGSEAVYQLVQRAKLVTEPTCIICDKKRKLVKVLRRTIK